MAFSGNNQTIFNAALDGALSGMLASGKLVDATQADYANMSATAMNFAAAVDAGIAADATLTNAGASQPPGTAAQTANSFAKFGIMFGLCFGYFFQRSIAGSAIPQTNFTTDATFIKAAFNQAVAQYALAAGGTSLS
jgi:hypothetical protein